MRKTKIIETVSRFPKEFDLDDLLERLIFMDKVEKGLEQVENGKTVKQSEVELYFKKKWQK